MKLVNQTQAIELLTTNNLVIIPTETVYGLGGDATSKEAVEKIYKFKNRPADNPLICHFYSIDQIKEYIIELPRFALELFNMFSPGPLTILLEPKDNRLIHATRGQKFVGCRIPNNSETLSLIKKLNRPIAAPSANPSTKPSATNAEMALNYFKDLPGGVLESTPSTIGLESTIIKIENNTVFILREGSIGEREIRSNPTIKNVVNLNKSKDVIPGQKYKHYSPSTDVVKLDDIEQLPPNSIVISTDHIPSSQRTIVISNSYNPKEISKNLYKTLISLDELATDTVYFYIPELFSDTASSSLEKALRERLSKVLQPYAEKK